MEKFDFDPFSNHSDDPRNPQESVAELKRIKPFLASSAEARKNAALIISALQLENMDHSDLVEFFVEHNTRFIADNVHIEEDVDGEIGAWEE